MSLNNISGAIIISASGMCEAGRIRHHLKYNLWRPDSTVLFVGYQATGTLGRQIVEKEKTVRIFGDEIAVRADVRSIESYSAHADQQGLLDWVRGFASPPKEIFVTHGEPAAATTLTWLLRTVLGLNATMPAWKQTVTLSSVSREDPFGAASESLAAKLRSAAKQDLTMEKQAEILRRLANLETYLTEELG